MIKNIDNPWKSLDLYYTTVNYTHILTPNKSIKIEIQGVDEYCSHWFENEGVIVSTYYNLQVYNKFVKVYCTTPVPACD